MKVYLVVGRTYMSERRIVFKAVRATNSQYFFSY